MRYGDNYWFVFLHCILGMGRERRLGGRSTTSSLLMKWNKFREWAGGTWSIGEGCTEVEGICQTDHNSQKSLFKCFYI